MAEQDVIPLSTRINKALIGALRLKESGSAIIAENGKKQLMAFTSIGITMGSEKYGFGGNRESIDHIKGNKGDGWHVVIALSEEEAIKYTLKTTLLIIIVGIVFTILAAAVALFLGKWATRPINELATVARAIGKGDLDSRARVFSNDEIGSLAKSLNGMAKNLRDTMTSRDELIHEVEQREKVEQKLRLLSTTDELTGAYNRRAFNGYLNSNIGRAKRYNEPLSMLMLDIDHFKDVNNSYGHDVGDMVLKDFVRIIKESIRHEDLIARWGGEEFTVLQPQTRKDAALKLSERLREKISAHDFPKAGRITVSIGLTELQVGDTADSFVKRADNALYLAKKGGRNVVKCC
ncbi:MAG: diguanylate cyclase [Desulfobacteraceae bacterium]|nr:diguanylate cyclase [Desulfobacteraceae bacterium]